MTIVHTLDKEQEEIFKKALDKAFDNGFQWGNGHDWSEYLLDRLPRDPDFNDELLEGEVWRVIFSHDFAMAFWEIAEMKYCNYPVCDKSCLPMWQYHLQQMVILPDAEIIKYLEQFL